MQPANSFHHVSHESEKKTTTGLDDEPRFNSIKLDSLELLSLLKRIVVRIKKKQPKMQSQPLLNFYKVSSSNLQIFSQFDFIYKFQQVFAHILNCIVAFVLLMNGYFNYIIFKIFISHSKCKSMKF